MENKPEKGKRFIKYMGTQFQQYKRVWRLLKKPTKEELKTITKVSLIGLLIIGAVGFAISLIMKVGLGFLFR